MRMCPAFGWIGREAGKGYIEGRREAGYLFQVTGQRQERIYFGLDEMFCLLMDCILPLIGMEPAF